MYRYQLDRLFKKFALLIAAIAVIMAFSKIFVTKYNYPVKVLNDEQLEIFDTLCEDTKDLTPKEKIAYVKKWRSDYSEKYYDTSKLTAAQKTACENNDEAYSAYMNQLLNCVYTVGGIKEYIKTGEGFRTFYYPGDLAENPNAYRNIKLPKSINDYYFRCFLSLQSMNLMPVFVLLLVGIFVADSYEKRIDLQIKISLKSRTFYKSREISLVLFIIVINFINLFFDMIISGMFRHLSYLNAPIQSVSSYVFFPTNMTIFQALLYIFFMELCGSLVCYNVFILLARHLRSIKFYLICSSTFVAFFTVISKFFSSLSPFCFTGINDKRVFLSSIKYYSTIESTILYPAAAVLVIALILLCVWRYTGYYESKKLRKSGN